MDWDGLLVCGGGGAGVLVMSCGRVVIIVESGSDFLGGVLHRMVLWEGKDGRAPRFNMVG